MRSVVKAVLLFLLSVIMISQGTYAFFTNRSDEIHTPFTLGSLQISPQAAGDPVDWRNWKPGDGNSKTIGWTFTNTGSKRALIRARINTSWDGLPSSGGSSGTAWGGTTIGSHPSAIPFGNEGGNRSRYFIIQGFPKTIEVAIGAKENLIGEVTISKHPTDYNKVVVEVRLNPGWGMQNVKENLKVHLTNNASDFAKNLPPGHFAYKVSQPLNDSKMSFEFNVNKGLDLNKTIYAAVHLDVKGSGGSTVNPQVYWEQTGYPAWVYMADGYWYYPHVLAPGEMAALSFRVWIDSIKNLSGGSYNIDLEVEAVQATNDSHSYFGWLYSAYNEY